MSEHRRIPEQIQTACELYVSGMSWEAIAEKMNRSVHTVRRWPERYPGLWRGFFQNEYVNLRERVFTEALVAARIILHNGEDKHRVPLIGHLARFEQGVHQVHFNVKRHRINWTKEISERYERDYEEYETQLEKRRKTRDQPEVQETKVDESMVEQTQIEETKAPEPELNASTKTNGLNVVTLGVMLLAGMALGGAIVAGASSLRENKATSIVAGASSHREVTCSQAPLGNTLSFEFCLTEAEPAPERLQISESTRGNTQVMSGEAELRRKCVSKQSLGTSDAVAVSPRYLSG